MKNLFLAALFLVVAAAAVTPVCSQVVVSPAGAIEAAREKSADIKNRSIEIERMRRQAAADRTRPVSESAHFPEIKEDFERIQIVNADSLQKPAVQKDLDYKTISKAVAEIRKRAVRLKSNLFPVSDDSAYQETLRKERDKFLQQEIRTLAIGVDNALYGFVSSSLFQNVKLVNLKDSEKAERDLEKIIFLCAVIETKIKTPEKNGKKP